MNIKYGLDTLQIVMFTNSIDFTDKLRFTQKLGKISSIKLDGEPTILPLPADAPLDIPRIILKSSDEKYIINSSPSRTDIIFREKKTDEVGVPASTIKDVKGDVINASIEIIDILKSFNANINRAAVVVKLLTKFEKSSKEYLQKFLLRKLEKKPFEVNIGLLYKEKVSNFQVNKWYRFETLRSIKVPEDDTALMLSLDVNTLTEVDYKFSQQTVKDFYDTTLKLIEKEAENFINENKKD